MKATTRKVKGAKYVIDGTGRKRGNGCGRGRRACLHEQLPQNYKFTGKERDSESDLDNFEARYYASTTGRFMSPDWALKPIAVPYAKFGDPQTLNLHGDPFLPIDLH